jgi:DNA-binding NarL/FixJ family response regulator
MYKNRDCTIRPTVIAGGKYNRAIISSMDYVDSREQSNGMGFAYKDRLRDKGDFIGDMLLDIELSALIQELEYRDQEIIRLLVKGYNQREVAKELGKSPVVVGTRVKGIRKKMDKFYKELKGNM